MKNALAQALAKSMPNETLLIAPTMGEGRRLLKMAASGGQLIMGVRPVTVKSLALEICEGELSKVGASRLMDRSEAQELVYSVLANEPEEGFFAGPHAKERVTAELFAELISELDSACAPEVEGGRTVNAVQKIRNAYKTAKGESLIDENDLISLAASRAKAYFDGRDTRFVTLSVNTFTQNEMELLNSLPNLETVKVPSPEGVPLPDSIIDKTAPKGSLCTDNVRFAACRGDDTEIRFILEDILEKGHKLEDCAVIYMSGESTGLLAAEAAAAGVPLTVSGGVPMAGTRVYGLVKMISGWKASDFDAEKLRALILDGAVSIPMPGRFCGRLRDKMIGWGKQRYYDRLLAVSDDEKYPPEDDVLNAWRAFTDAAVNAAEMQGDIEKQKKDLRALIAFLRVTGSDEAKTAALARAQLDSVTMLEEGETVISRLLDVMGDASCLKGGDEGGKLWAVPLAGAFATGRKHLYICGMSRFCMQGSRAESPLMPDEIKQKYGLATTADREKINSYRLQQLILCHEGDIVMSYSDYDTEKMIALPPAPIFTRLMGDRKPEKISCVPRAVWSIGDIMGRGEGGKIAAVPCAKADKAPDGYIEQIEGMAFSPSSLETALHCPLSFYLKYVLKLREPEIPEKKRDEWLDAAAKGTLIHRVLERYFAEKGDIDGIFADEIELCRQEYPSAAPDVMRKQTEDLRAMAGRAVKWTEESGRRVIGTEQAFGRNAGEEPLKIEVGGRTIGLSGSIDRVDELENGSLAILDYKTGSPDKYRDSLDSKLQPYLYARAYETMNPGASVNDAGYLFLKSMPDFLPVPQNAEERELKERLLMKLFEMMRDEKAMQASADEFSASELILTDEEKAELEAEGQEPSKNGSQQCSRYCEFADFCKKAREGK